MPKKNLDLLSSRELLIYIQECAEKGLDDEMMRAHRFLLIKEGENPDDNSDIHDYYEPSEFDLTKYNESDFENLNSDELMSVISNHEDFYSDRQSKKAIAIFIRKKKENPNFSEHDSDLEWAESVKVTLGQKSKADWILILIPLIIPFGFMFKQIVIRKNEFSSFNLGVFGILLIVTIGYSIRKYSILTSKFNRKYIFCSHFLSI